VREHYGIERREDLRLSDYNTLAKVMVFVKDGVKHEGVNCEPEEAVTAPELTVHDSRLTVHDSEIQQYLLSIVSEKTGYPAEMLELDLDLEADLGIDTVKQAELFAAVREHYGIERREDLRLSDYNTLAKVMAFVREGVHSSEALSTEDEEVQSSVSKGHVEGIGSSSASQNLEPLNSAPQNSPTQNSNIHRRVPVPVLRPTLALCQPTGIELGEGANVLIVADRGGVGDALERKLLARKVRVTKLPVASVKEIHTRLTLLENGSMFTGVYFLPGLDAEPSLAEIATEDWNAMLEERLFSLAALLRELPELSFLVCATRMGGLHAYGPQDSKATVSGGLRGLAKAIARERQKMVVKVVDFEQDAGAAKVAGCLVDETLSDPGTVEIGLEGSLRYGIALAEKPLGEPERKLPQGAVVVISGGSGGIVAPVVQDLARATRGHFYLLGRSALPSENDPDLALLRSDREGIKREIARRISESGERATPSRVEGRLAALERAVATLETMAETERLGGTATYLPCDVTDLHALELAVKSVMAKEGRIDVLVHAAGLDHSRKLESKPDEEFRQVVSVKASGFFNLWKVLEKQKALPGFAAVFTSISGRFGNSGQTDYSAANDFAARLAAAIQSEHPEIRVVALDWGAWADVGMASRGYIPRLMQLAGIEMLNPLQAAPLVRAELLAGTESEVILAGALGQLEDGSDAAGGLDLERANEALRAGKPIHSMLSRVTGMSLKDGILLEADLDPNTEPFLKDHALNGIPVLPGVMGIEGFTVAAKHIASVLGSSRAGFEVVRLDDIRFLAPFKFYRNQPRRSAWKARVLRTAEGLVADVVLESDMLLHNKTVEHMRHFSGRVALQPLMEHKELVVQPPQWNGAYTVQAAEIYKLYFHGPAFQVLAGVQRSGEMVLGKLQRDLPAITSGGQTLFSTPILLELCLQTAGVWEAGLTGTLALPSSIGQLRLHKNKTNGAAIFAEVSPSRLQDGSLIFDARVVDAKGRVYLEVEKYRTSPLPYSVKDELIQPFKVLVQGK
jgi:NAD(P)-dependent dehydrogenase (short-subunit alcohol dehydrogenase family)/acyl carrier protein